jgi:hypothetical protein
MSNDNQVGGFQPSKDPKIFFRQVRAGVLAPIPYLVHNHWYSLKDLLTGTDLWDETGTGVHIRAGRHFAWAVGKELVPFKDAPGSEDRSGTCYYLYIGPEIYLGGYQNESQANPREN